MVQGVQEHLPESLAHSSAALGGHMSMPKYAARRDAVESDIAAAALKLGVRMWQLSTPVDWLVLIGGRWFPAEIKDPSKQGHKDEFTPQQQIFLTEALNARGTVLVWHSIAEMVADVQRIRVSQR